MKNVKTLSKNNLIENLKKFSEKKICAMIKCNAYGHGTKEIISMLEPFVEYFGVVNIQEGIMARKFTKKPILICSKVDDFKTCKKHNLEFIIDDENDLKKCNQLGITDCLHLKINCGMNRFGVKSNLNLKMINQFLIQEKITLKSISTHFPYTKNKRATRKNYQTFLKNCSEISQNAPICFGGSGIINHHFDYDMIRVGIALYGYGQENLLPVMQICSFVCKVFYVNKGEFVGYGKKFKARRSMKLAVVPVGYGDGLRRNLSGKFCVEIGKKQYKVVGNICMDAFFVKIDENVCVGEKVIVMQNAKSMAEKIDTIPYEILTGFSNFRGKTIEI